MSTATRSATHAQKMTPSPEAANRPTERLEAIKTERLILREFEVSDVAGFHQLESKPEVVRYQTWPPRTLEQAQNEVSTIIQNRTLSPRSHIELAVLHEDKFIGRVGTNIRRSDESSGPTAEVKPAHADLWFSFMPNSQGKGLATEAMRAFILLLGPGLELEIECDPRNIGSVKMAQRLGFQKISLTENAFECKGEWVDSLVFQKLV
ncbi:UPF0157-domain-containing protein [Acrodontium crateriforme]|uniref:UPF0157-domain-containing protein n=1 Tax=Acrodontium crateriforme TaxID=150365 RepID=A0AAQ3LY92_9PEZI|nr:UPF0157-domain-containing protein [Acrodontium crateriforme]